MSGASSDKLTEVSTELKKSRAATVVTVSRNSGGGTLGIGSVTCPASWCNVSGIPGTIGGVVEVRSDG